MSRRAAFRQRDITRVVKALEEAGAKVSGVTITADGTVTILTGDSKPPEPRARFERRPMT